MAIKTACRVGIGGNNLVYGCACRSVRVNVSGGIVAGGTGARSVGSDIMECLDVIHTI